MRCRHLAAQLVARVATCSCCSLRQTTTDDDPAWQTQFSNKMAPISCYRISIAGRVSVGQVELLVTMSKGLTAKNSVFKALPQSSKSMVRTQTSLEGQVYAIQGLLTMSWRSKSRAGPASVATQSVYQPNLRSTSLVQCR